MQDALKNGAHVVVDDAAGGGVVNLAAPAGPTGGDGKVVEGEDLCLVPGAAPLTQENVHQLGGVAVLAPGRGE